MYIPLTANNKVFSNNSDVYTVTLFPFSHIISGLLDSKECPKVTPTSENLHVTYYNEVLSNNNNKKNFKYGISI